MTVSGQSTADHFRSSACHASNLGNFLLICILAGVRNFTFHLLLRLWRNLLVPIIIFVDNFLGVIADYARGGVAPTVETSERCSVLQLLSRR